MEDIYHVSESQWAFFDVDYSLDLKSQYPEIWAMSGGQKSDEAHAVLLEILGNNGYALTPEQVNVLNLRESWANRHFEDRTALGNIAQVKWLVESFDGEPFQKKSINSEVSKFYLRQEWYAEKGAKGPCWPGYKQVGMKVGKRGTMVPNCVPVGAKDAQESEFDEYDEKSLKKWFKEKWVDISRPKDGGGFEPCGRDNTDGGKYPKCVPASKASKMSAEEIRSAVSRKRKAESSQQRDDKKPINVSTDAKDARFEIEEKSATPTNPELYSRVKAEAKKKFDVYPSAYANAWLVREYKKRGGGYREGKDLDGEFEDNIYDLNEKQLFDFYEWMEEKSAKSKLRNPKGGLTAAGRKYFNRTQGSNLKPGVKGAANTPEKMRRKGSFLTRFFTNPSGPMKDDKGRPTRLALSAAAWGEPVPQDASDAARLAAKGRRMLDRYQNSKKKDAELGIETKAEKQFLQHLEEMPDDEFNKTFPEGFEEKFLFGVGVAFGRRAIMNRRKRRKKRRRL